MGSAAKVQEHHTVILVSASELKKDVTQERRAAHRFQHTTKDLYTPQLRSSDRQDARQVG